MIGYESKSTSELKDILKRAKICLDSVWDEENGIEYNDCIQWEKYYREKIEEVENILKDRYIIELNNNL